MSINRAGLSVESLIPVLTFVPYCWGVRQTDRYRHQGRRQPQGHVTVTGAIRNVRGRPIWVGLAPNGTNMGLFKINFSRF